LQAACAYLEAILVATLLALFARSYLFEAFEIPSGSMERTLLIGDHVLVDKAAYAPHLGPWRIILPYRDVARGDVVVFRSPEEPTRDFVKRSVGLSGDSIRTAGSLLFRNGTLAVEPYARYKEDGNPSGSRWGPVTVAPDSFLALGDNRDDSRDSRTFGAVPLSMVKGRPLFVYWSREPMPGARFQGRGAGLRRFLEGAVHFFDRTRWGRTFLRVR
jgi:signal peptidase I